MDIARPTLKRPRSPTAEVQAWLDAPSDDSVRITGLDLDFLPQRRGDVVVMDVLGSTRAVKALSTSFAGRAEPRLFHGCAVYGNGLQEPLNVRASALLGTSVYGAVAIVRL